MGAFENKELILKSKENNYELLKQLLECYGLNVEKEYKEVVCNCELDEKELDEIFAISNTLFNDVSLYYESSGGHSVTDYYYGTKISYSCDGIKETETYDYCYGEGTINDKPVWIILKDECENQAKKKHIKVEWDEEYGLYPAGDDGDDFYDLCQSILRNHGDLEGLSTKKVKTDIKFIIINQETIQKIIENANKYKYKELLKILEQKKSENNIFPDYENKNLTDKKEDKGEKEIILENINNNKKVSLKKVDEKLKDDKDVVLAVIKSDVGNAGEIRYASDRLKDDEEVVLEAVKRYGDDLKYASDRLRDDEKVVLEAVNCDVSGDVFKYASDRLKSDRDFIKKAVKLSSCALKYANKELKEDKDYGLEILKIEGYCFEYLNNKLRNDKDVAKVAIDNCKRGVRLIVMNLGAKLKEDKEIALIAVKKDGQALSYLSEQLREDKEVQNAALKSGYPLDIASDEIRNNKEVVLKSLEKCGADLEYVSDRLKDDKEVVLIAVKNDYENGETIQYASDRLKDDKDIILEAVRVTPYALKYASDRLKNDKEVVLEALKKSTYPRYFIGESLKNDPDIKKILEKDSV